MLMMRPAPRRRMCGTTARVVRTMPRKLVSKRALACSTELSSAAAGAMPKPALLTNRSIRPSNVSNSWMAASTLASSVTSSTNSGNPCCPACPPRRLVP
ncbi:hypothetical protein D3C76_1206160 [compost metagenome]